MWTFSSHSKEEEQFINEGGILALTSMCLNFRITTHKFYRYRYETDTRQVNKRPRMLQQLIFL
jgi:hypothetical protein